MVIFFGISLLKSPQVNAGIEMANNRSMLAIKKKQIQFTRKNISNMLMKSPGIRYRELLRMTGLTNGVLSYHLNFLDNTGKDRSKSG